VRSMESAAAALLAHPLLADGGGCWCMQASHNQ